MYIVKFKQKQPQKKLQHEIKEANKSYKKKVIMKSSKFDQRPSKLINILKVLYIFLLLLFNIDIKKTLMNVNKN